MKFTCNVILNKIDDNFNIVTIPCKYYRVRDNYLICFITPNEVVACFNCFEIIGFYILEN